MGLDDPFAVGFLAFDDMTTLDLIGAHDSIVRLDDGDARDLEWELCAPDATATGARGTTIEVDRVRPSLASYDLVLVPGGPATRELVADESFLDWLRTASPCDLIASVCTGSLLLGAAGFLEDRTAATHPDARDLLADYCEVSTDRIVDQGDVVTAGGVTAGIDLGLHLVERLAGEAVRADVAASMDYADPLADGS